MTCGHILSFSIFWNSCVRLELLVPPAKNSGSGFFYFWEKILNYSLKIFHDYFVTWMFCFFLESILANCDLFISPTFFIFICKNLSWYTSILLSSHLQEHVSCSCCHFVFYLHISPFPPFLPHFPVQGQGYCPPHIELSPKESTWRKLDTYGLCGP